MDPIFDQVVLLEFEDPKLELMHVRVWNKTKRKGNLIGEWIGTIEDMLKLQGNVQAMELQIDRQSKGTLLVSCIAEPKHTGYLTLRIESAELMERCGAKVAETRCVVRFADNRSISRARDSVLMPEGYIIEWAESYTFNVSRTNNNKDIFVDVLQGESLLGYCRFAIHDAYRGFAGTKDLVRARTKVGLIYFSLKLD
eukprot:TRINITY_DN7908_c0_g2_i1.p1 TRINITY_DN7908_c0_g2~~TRINITY_DN7908_c0_g2_i1.p1  ORF type:complete len:197 (-),score=40.75 TRINITY_DN7908_c0_g2_i1:130-720(-)